MKVYVLETGCYEQAAISGVYATLEAAMAAWAPKPRPLQASSSRVVYDSTLDRTSIVHSPPLKPLHNYTWSERDGDRWSFGADWDDAADITEYEVQT